MPASCPFRRNPLLTVFWAILLIALIAASGGFWLRYQNEAQNQTVIVTADYEEFLKTSNTAAIHPRQLVLEPQGAVVHAARVEKALQGQSASLLPFLQLRNRRGILDEVPERIA